MMIRTFVSLRCLAAAIYINGVFETWKTSSRPLPFNSTSLAPSGALQRMRVDELKSKSSSSVKDARVPKFKSCLKRAFTSPDSDSSSDVFEKKL